MSFELNLTLRQKLIVYCLVFLSPVVALSYFLVGENYSYAKQSRLDSISARSALVENSIDSMIESTTKFLENLAEIPAVRERDQAASTKLFSSLLPLYPSFSTLVSVDQNGTPVASVQKVSSPSAGIADRSYFQHVMRTGKPTVSGRLMGRVTDQPVFAVAVPIWDDNGSVAGAVVAGVSLKLVQQSLDRLGQESGEIVVIDSDGFILSHPDWRNVLEATNRKTVAPLELALTGRSGTVEYTDSQDGEDWLSAYRPLTKAPWAVAVKYRASLVYSPVYTTILKWSFYVLAASVLAVVLAFFTASRISRRLKRMTRRMISAVPAGSKVQIPPEGIDEFRQLTSVFNRVCSRLASTSEELADVKGEFVEQAKKLDLLSRRAIKARDEERRRLAMDIHDGVLQLLAAAQGQMRLARASTDCCPDSVTGKLEQVELILEQALVELRSIARGVHPPGLDVIGLVCAVYHHMVVLKDLFSIPRLSLYVTGSARRLRTDTEMAAFRIVQESLSNVGKHAVASVVKVYIDFDLTCFRIAVVDDGRGFNVRDMLGRQGSQLGGLENIIERAEGVGGTCTILSMPGEGTRVEVTIPYISYPLDQPALVASLES